jgi:hypothetical protein
VVVVGNDNEGEEKPQVRKRRMKRERHVVRSIDSSMLTIPRQER